MRIHLPLALTLLTSLQAQQPAAAHPVTAGPLATAELRAAITAQDRLLFALVFDRCDMAAFADLLAEDFQMLHDKHGLTPTKAALVEDMRQTWAGRATGQNVRARRECVSEAVYPMATDRALHVGTHRFYGLTPGQPDVLRETGQFFHEYRLQNGRWKLARVYSFDHRPAQ